MKKFVCSACFALLLAWGQAAPATELVYTPVNPSFGGNPLNGTVLLNQAQAQNKHKDPDSSSSSSRDPMEYFEESLIRRVLNNLATSIVDDAFGSTDSELTSGHYQFGDYTIDVDTSLGDNVGVTITDVGTGNTTTIEVPTTY